MGAVAAALWPATPDIDLSTSTTQHLVEDTEALRRLNGVDSWLAFGGS